MIQGNKLEKKTRKRTHSTHTLKTHRAPTPKGPTHVRTRCTRARCVHLRAAVPTHYCIHPGSRIQARSQVSVLSPALIRGLTRSRSLTYEVVVCTSSHSHSLSRPLQRGKWAPPAHISRPEEAGGDALYFIFWIILQTKNEYNTLHAHTLAHRQDLVDSQATFYFYGFL